MHRWLLLCLPLLAAACSATGQSDTYEASDLDSDEGFVAFRLGSADMLNDPNAVFGTGFRLHYRLIESRPMIALFGSTRFADHIKVEGGDHEMLYVLPLTGGRYVFHSVVSSMQEGDIDVQFDVIPGQVTYIGEIVVYMKNEVNSLGLSTIEKVDVSVYGYAQDIEDQLRPRFPDGLPKVETRLAESQTR